MNETIPLSPYAHTILSEKQKELISIINRKRKPTPERQRELNECRKELFEIDGILKNSFVRPFDEKNPAMVQIGSKVILENLSSGDKREYTIMTCSTADPLKGVLSNESPLAQKMLGLNLGNTFKYKDYYGQAESYKIKSIE